MLDGRISDSVGMSIIMFYLNQSNEYGTNDNFVDLGPYCTRMEWSACIGNGYQISCFFDDFHHISMNRILQDYMLKHARNMRLYVKFSFGWDMFGMDKSLRWIDESIGVITEIRCPGVDRNINRLSFSAIDPASRYLNRGDGSGKAYRGTIGGPKGVISQVIKEYTEDLVTDLNDLQYKPLNIHVDDTHDNNENTWYNMRMHPNAFINSLTSWSAPLTLDNTPWIMQSQNNNIRWKCINNLKPPLDHRGEPFIGRVININAVENTDSELLPNGIELLNNPNLAVTQSKLYTSGISTVTGKYVDKITDQSNVETYDLNTSAKLNVNIDKSQGFTKPGASGADADSWAIPEWATYIASIPEHNNYDVGLKYWDYISGRSRDYFIKSLYTTMRICVTIFGDPNFDNVDILGSSSVYLDMLTSADRHYLSGLWMVYGFVHYVTNRTWKTHLYLSRLDWNAIATHI